MKAKSLLSIIPALMLTGLSARAQDLDDVYIDDSATGSPIINNYYSDYDYYYTSRIFRFHRPYVAFNYYSPFFTDTYWYTYQPFNLGISIYGGCFGLSLGCNIGYPVNYYNDYYPDYYYSSWNDPYFYGSGYWGYRPFYRNYWYSPGFLNPFTWNRWNYHRWDWRDGYRYNNFYHGDYRNNYYSYNGRYGSRNDRYDRQGGSSEHSSSVYENRRNGDGSVRHSGQQIPSMRNSSINSNLRRNADVKHATAIENNHNQIRRSTTVRNSMLADAGSNYRSGNIRSGTYRNNNMNRSTVSNSRSIEASGVSRERISMPSRNNYRTSAVNEKRNFNFSGESPAARHSFQGPVRNAGQARPLTSITGRSFSEGRRGNISMQAHSAKRSGGTGGHSARSNSGQHGRRR